MSLWALGFGDVWRSKKMGAPMCAMHSVREPTFCSFFPSSEPWHHRVNSRNMFSYAQAETTRQTRSCLTFILGVVGTCNHALYYIKTMIWHRCNMYMYIYICIYICVGIFICIWIIWFYMYVCVCVCVCVVCYVSYFVSKCAIMWNYSHFGATRLVSK